MPTKGECYYNAPKATVALQNVSRFTCTIKGVQTTFVVPQYDKEMVIKMLLSIGGEFTYKDEVR